MVCKTIQKILYSHSEKSMSKSHLVKLTVSSSRGDVVYKKKVPKNFAKFTEKQLCLIFLIRLKDPLKDVYPSKNSTEKFFWIFSENSWKNNLGKVKFRSVAITLLGIYDINDRNLYCEWYNRPFPNFYNTNVKRNSADAYIENQENKNGCDRDFKSVLRCYFKWWGNILPRESSNYAWFFVYRNYLKQRPGLNERPLRMSVPLHSRKI